MKDWCIQNLYSFVGGRGEILFPKSDQVKGRFKKKN